MQSYARNQLKIMNQRKKKYNFFIPSNWAKIDAIRNLLINMHA